MSKQARTNEANTMANLSEKGELEESEDSPVEDLESESAHSSSNYSASKGSSDEESEDDVSLADSNLEVPFEKDFDYNSDIPSRSFTILHRVTPPTTRSLYLNYLINLILLARKAMNILSIQTL